jgi:uncharacterized protein YndB with AHSA1/START domain
MILHNAAGFARRRIGGSARIESRPRRMRPVSATIVLDVPRERVFDFLSDLANRESFTHGFIEDLRLERLDSSGVGAAARFRIVGRGIGMWMETVIAELDRPHRIYETGHGGRTDRIATFTVWELVEAGGEGTEVTVTFWTEPTHPWDKIREKLGHARRFRKKWRSALEQLREVLERGGPVERVRVAGEPRIPV